MWIMSTDGFISMVRHNKIPDTMLVRARVKADLETTFPGYEIETKIGADYLYRALVPVADVAAIVAEQVKALDYTSHAKDEMIRRSPKTEVGNRGTALYATWTAFSQLQPYAPYAKEPRPKPAPYKAVPPMVFTDRVRTGNRAAGTSHYDWSSHPQSASYVGPETIVPGDDYADVPDDAFAMSDEEWEDFLQHRAAEKKKKPAKKSRNRSRGGRKHKK